MLLNYKRLEQIFKLSLYPIRKFCCFLICSNLIPFAVNLKMAEEYSEAPGVAVVHEDDRKLFVGALPQEAKDSDIKEYFESYGEIENITLKMDAVTGRSRGFAFVVFKTTEGIDAALQQGAHVVKVMSNRQDISKLKLKTKNSHFPCLG